MGENAGVCGGAVWPWGLGGYREVNGVGGTAHGSHYRYRNGRSVTGTSPTLTKFRAVNVYALSRREMY